MWWKKGLALTAALILVMGALTGCGVDNQERYEQGQLYLGYKDYETARQIFQELGEYEDAGRYELYCAALMALQAGDTARAQADFSNLEGFKSSDLYLAYLEAQALETAGELEAAQAEYQALGSFGDSADRAGRLQGLIPQRDYASAQTLMAVGQYRQALAAFTALGDYENSAQLAAACQEQLFQEALNQCRQPFAAGAYEKALEAIARVDLSLTPAMQAQLDQLAESCRAALYEQAVQGEQKGLAAAEETLALYEALGDYQDSAQKAEALAKRYGKSMGITDYQGQWQYISLGSYPESTPLLWRVIKCYEGKALLLADSILESRGLCQPGETFTTYQDSSLRAWLCGDFAGAAFTQEQRAALAGEDPVFLLSAEEARLLPQNLDRQAQGSAHAQAQGLRESSQGLCWWWLRDQGQLSGCQAIVYFNGVVYDKGVQVFDAQTGVRPAIWLDLSQYTLTQGQGTLTDPFR